MSSCVVRPLVLSAALAATCFASRARAHAPPEVQRIVWKNDRELTLVSNRGLMFGQADAPNFRLMCNEALHINYTEQPSVAYRRDGGLLAATSNGLFLTLDEGCSWEPVAPLVDLFVPVLAQLPGDPDTLLAATFGTGQSAIRVTHDGGRSWSVLTPLTDHDYTRTLLAAPQDPTQLYATGTVIVQTPSPHTAQYMARSKNAGQDWERTEITLNDGELSLLLLAVSPVQSEVLLARASSATPGLYPERLLVSRDGGKTFSSVLSVALITGATFSSDGQSAWLASSEGIFQAGATLDDFQRRGTIDHLTCVDYQHGELWTCGHYGGAGTLLDGVGHTHDPAGGVFDRLMVFSDVDVQITCAADAPSVSTCVTPWADFHTELSRGQPADAGPVLDLDAGAASSAEDAAAPEPAEDPDADAVSMDAASDDDDASAAGLRRKRSSGCTVLTWQGSTSRFDGALSALLAFSLGVGRRRRRSSLF